MFAEALVCLALNVYHEARDQPPVGQSAAAHVVLNRVIDRRFPGTVCGVVLQGGEVRRHRCQFSWYCDGRSDKPYEQDAWEKAKQVANQAMAGSADPTEGALYYHALYVEPFWAIKMEHTVTIGTHRFYKEKWP